MTELQKLEAVLEKEWRAFIGLLSTKVIVKSLNQKLSLNESLRARLSQSHFFKSKLENIPQMSVQRKNEWVAGRQSELEMEEHFLKLCKVSEGDLLTSLSHTWCGELSCSASLSLWRPFEEKNIQSVGIDIESKTRPLSEEVIKRFMNPKEVLKANKIHPIDFWVLKEAAFKATPRDMQLVVTQYSIEEWDDKNSQGVMVSKNISCHVKLVRTESFAVGLAYHRL